MDRQKENTDNLLPYLAATAPALFQLVAVTSIGLTNILSLRTFLFLPEFLNVANLFVVLFTLTLITLTTWWDSNRFNLEFQPNTIFDFTKSPKIFWKYFRITVILAILSGVIFLCIAVNKIFIENYFESYTSFWTTAEWIAYILSLTLMSYSIYIFVLLKIQARNVKALQDNFVPRLMDSLRRYGYVNDPDIIIKKLDRNNGNATVIINKTDIYDVKTDFTGEMIEINAVIYSPPLPRADNTSSE